MIESSVGCTIPRLVMYSTSAVGRMVEMMQNPGDRYSPGTIEHRKGYAPILSLRILPIQAAPVAPRVAAGRALRAKGVGDDGAAPRSRLLQPGTFFY
jgi:hypothetical protein